MEDFMGHMLKTQRLLLDVEKSNREMKQMANRIAYQKSAEVDFKKQSVDKIVKEVRDHCSSIQSHLAFMKDEIEQSKQSYATEPETRVKQTVHRTFTHKFHDLVRETSTLQGEFKNLLN